MIACCVFISQYEPTLSCESVVNIYTMSYGQILHNLLIVYYVLIMLVSFVLIGAYLVKVYVVTKN